MRTIKAQKLTVEGFRPFGDFCNFLQPEGHNLGDFFHDKLLDPMEKCTPFGFSPLIAHKREKMIITAAEYHNHTPEILVPLDSDIVIHVAPASNGIVPEKTQAFIVPKGTGVRLNTGVFHLCPFSIEKEEGHVLVALPERTYFNDCIVCDYEEKDYIEITL
jgi:ureidoglycolate lyase